VIPGTRTSETVICSNENLQLEREMPTDKEIVSRIERQPSRAAGYKQLVKELGLRGGHERRDLEERLKRLVSRGELIEVNRDRFALPSAAANRNLIAGTLQMHRDG